MIPSQNHWLRVQTRGGACAMPGDGSPELAGCLRLSPKVMISSTVGNLRWPGPPMVLRRNHIPFCPRRKLAGPMVIFTKVAGYANCLKEPQTTLVSSCCKRAHRDRSQGLHFTTRSAGSSIRADRPLSCSFLQKCFTSCSPLHHFLG